MAGIKLSAIKANPNNPRLIKDDKFKKLCQSIKDLPKMMELRPIVIDENNIVQGGNMRLLKLDPAIEIRKNGQPYACDKTVKKCPEKVA